MNKKKQSALAPTGARRKVHYTANYLVDPQHPVTVNVIGCGGTGSQVINSLARMHSALKALNHPGLFVRAIDPDRVSVANMGRQLFSPSDVGEHKASVLIGRVNRFFGTDWESVPQLYTAKSGIAPANITISCVDTGAARKQIKAILMEYVEKRKRSNPPAGNYGYYVDRGPHTEPYEKPYYWMDFGNMMDRGQVVIGTVGPVDQPHSDEFEVMPSLMSVDGYHPDILKDGKGDDQGPSCSLAEALTKQDLFINTNLANMGLGLLWKMFRELRIHYHGLYLNLQTMNVNPIPVR